MDTGTICKYFVFAAIFYEEKKYDFVSHWVYHCSHFKIFTFSVVQLIHSVPQGIVLSVCLSPIYLVPLRHVFQIC